MKRRFEVLWTAVAEHDLMDIVSFIAAENPAAAVEMLDRIEAGAGALDRFPRRGRVVPELREHGITRYHEVVVEPWRVVYRVEASVVYILAVIDGRRNVEDVLLSRLLR